MRQKERQRMDIKGRKEGEKRWMENKGGRKRGREGEGWRFC